MVSTTTQLCAEWLWENEGKIRLFVSRELTQENIGNGMLISFPALPGKRGM